MPTVEESICCREIPKVLAKIQEDDDDQTCIILHPGFQQVCLAEYALQVAYVDFRHRYGSMPASQAKPRE
jgi:hypothetical protein